MPYWMLPTTRALGPSATLPVAWTLPRTTPLTTTWVATTSPSMTPLALTETVDSPFAVGANAAEHMAFDMQAAGEIHIAVNPGGGSDQDVDARLRPGLTVEHRPSRENSAWPRLPLLRLSRSVTCTLAG